MFCSCRISTDKRVAWSLCHSRASCCTCHYCRGRQPTCTGASSQYTSARRQCWLSQQDVFSVNCWTSKYQASMFYITVCILWFSPFVIAAGPATKSTLVSNYIDAVSCGQIQNWQKMDDKFSTLYPLFEKYFCVPARLKECSAMVAFLWGHTAQNLKTKLCVTLCSCSAISTCSERLRQLLFEHVMLHTLRNCHDSKYSAVCLVVMNDWSCSRSRSNVGYYHVFKW